jgi:hypothetical protein
MVFFGQEMVTIDCHSRSPWWMKKSTSVMVSIPGCLLIRCRPILVVAVGCKSMLPQQYPSYYCGHLQRFVMTVHQWYFPSSLHWETTGMVLPPWVAEFHAFHRCLLAKTDPGFYDNQTCNVMCFRRAVPIQIHHYFERTYASNDHHAGSSLTSPSLPLSLSRPRVSCCSSHSLLPSRPITRKKRMLLVSSCRLWLLHQDQERAQERLLNHRLLSTREKTKKHHHHHHLHHELHDLPQWFASTTNIAIPDQVSASAT